MKRLYYIGIDPGLGGAIAVLHVDTGIEAIFDMPTHLITVNGKVRRKLDHDALAKTLANYEILADLAFVVIEDPHALPGQGVVSSFSFGRVCGALEQAVAGVRLPRRLISPARWKKELGLTADKDECRRAATRRYPQFADWFSRKSDDGRAEAVLLAEYGKEKSL